MSLIHKALKKVEGPDPSKIEDIVTPEEGIFAEKKSDFFSVSLTPITLILVIIIILAGIFAIYINFFSDSKTGKQVYKQSEAVKQKEIVKSAVVEAEKVQPSSSGSDINKGPSTSGDVEFSPEVKAYMEEGEKYLLDGNYEQAITKFGEALALAPNSSEVSNSLGLACKKKGDLVSADKYYLNALKHNPNCSECLNNIGVLKADQNDNVSAVLYFRKAINVNESYADPYFNLAVIMEKEGNYKSAVDNYKKFLAYTSSDDENLKEKIRARIEEIALDYED